MAEWLRRLTWNQMGSTRAGSNPADCDQIFLFSKKIRARDLLGSNQICINFLAYAFYSNTVAFEQTNTWTWCLSSRESVLKDNGMKWKELLESAAKRPIVCWLNW